MINQRLTFVTFAFWCFANLASPAVAQQTTYTGTTMGPIAYKVIVCDSLADPVSVEQGIADRLEQINRLMSTYLDSSDVSRFNTAAAHEWVQIDPLTLRVINRSIAISEQTNGTFDITVGPAVNRWKFGPDSESQEFPSDEEVAQMLQFVGFKHLETRPSPPSIRKSDARTKIDLSAIAKGFAVDQVVTFLREKQLKNFMVEVGGEVYASGTKPDGAWTIGIEEPKYGRIELQGGIEIKDVAVATSGDYRNFQMYDGRKISHTISPYTCRPVAESPASCSVMAGDCLTADALATAIMVMGAKKGHEFCKANGIESNIIARSDAKFTSATTDGFPRLIPLKELQTAAATLSTPEPAQSIWPAFIGALVIFSLAIVGMAVGAIFNNKPIKGSCGGISPTSSEDGETACSLCHKPVADCPENSNENKATG